MQKVLNFFNSPVPFYLLTSLAITAIILAGVYLTSAHATPYAWNEATFTSMTHETLPTPTDEIVLMDLDKDSFVDTIYNRNDLFFNKTWGTSAAVNNFTITKHVDSANGHTKAIHSRDNYIMFINPYGTGGSNCSIRADTIDVLTGNVNFTSYHHSGVNDVPEAAGGIIGNSGDISFYVRCVANMYFGSHETPAQNFTKVIDGGDDYTSPNAMYWRDSLNSIEVFREDNMLWNTANGTTTYTEGKPFGIYDNNTNTWGKVTGEFDISNDLIYQETIQLYMNGLLYPANDEFHGGNEQSLMNYAIDPSKSLIDTIMLTDLVEINSNFDITNHDIRFMLKNSSGNYIGIIDDTTVHLLDYDQMVTDNFVNRAYALLRIDFDATQDGKTLELGEMETEATMRLVQPDFTDNAETFNAHQVLPSGYKLRADSSKLRYYQASHINDLTSYMSPQTNTQTHSELTLEIKNAFPDTSVRIRDTIAYDSNIPEYYIWLVDELQTDNTITFEIPANECVYVDIKNIGISNGQWTQLGFLCHNGLTYKVLPNTSELSYQFWAFPLGANHIYNQTAEDLQTQVRSNTSPYQYVTKIYDANDVVVLDQIINSSSDFNLQTFNTTNYTKPLRLEILDYDNSNQTVYTANLGFGNYLSGIALFINQYLVYEGFNLVILMPLIFMAMFTRNTVGIGTVLFVVLVATLVWFGVISLSEWVIYAMMVIAVIGLIAYKTRS